jgi:hypothetical protein
MSNDKQARTDQLKERHEVPKDLEETLFSRQQNMIDDAGERYAQITPTKLTGQSPSVPEQPAHSPWHSDPVPPEEPLGYSIDALPELGGASPALPCAVESATPDRGGSSEVKDDPPQLIRRRRL